MILEITAPHVARWTARQPSFTAERQQEEDLSESELAAIMPTLPRAQAVQHESRQGRRSGLRRRRGPLDHDGVPDGHWLPKKTADPPFPQSLGLIPCA